MKVRYDREADILVIEWLPGGVIDHAEHTGSLIAHFTADGRLVLLEILDARRFLAQVLQAALQGGGDVDAGSVHEWKGESTNGAW